MPPDTLWPHHHGLQPGTAAAKADRRVGSACPQTCSQKHPLRPESVFVRGGSRGRRRGTADQYLIRKHPTGAKSSQVQSPGPWEALLLPQAPPLGRMTCGRLRTPPYSSQKVQEGPSLHLEARMLKLCKPPVPASTAGHTAPTPHACPPHPMAPRCQTQTPAHPR